MATRAKQSTLVDREVSLSAKTDNDAKNLIQMENFSKSDCRKKKYSMKHQICLTALERGFHETFSQMYKIFEHQQALRKFHGNDSAFYLIPLLEKQYDKLIILRDVLQEREIAARKKDFRRMYNCYVKLAEHFLSTGDSWLADFFYNKALGASSDLKENDGGQANAEATYFVAKCHERNENMPTAVEFYESFYSQVIDKSWVDSVSGDLLSLIAARCLVNSYTFLSKDKKYDTHSKLQKSYEIAKKSGNEELMTDTSYRLGQFLLKNDRNAAQFALKYLQESAENSDKLGDLNRRCLSQRALANCYDALGNKEKSLKALMTFRDLAETAQDAFNISSAHLDFGAACNSDGDYAKAVASFTKAYTTALTGAQPAQLDIARAWVGIAMAHDYLKSFSELLISQNMSMKDSIQAMAKWKASRQGLTKGPASS